jgi:hypothetical protein
MDSNTSDDVIDSFASVVDLARAVNNRVEEFVHLHGVVILLGLPLPPQAAEELSNIARLVQGLPGAVASLKERYPAAKD